MAMKTSTRGINLIKSFESFSATTYTCPAGVLTQGYGSTRGIVKGSVITESQATQMLMRDLEDFERVINREVTQTLNQNQFDALASFVYNVGGKAFSGSTLLRELNIPDYAGAADEFLRWNKAKGKVLPGLTRRREAERALFLSVD